MGKIVVSEFVSLDGVVEAPGGEPNYRHTGWVARFQDEAQIDWKMREVMAHEALLIGRVTYESFAGAWPHFDGPFADKMNAMPKYVASTTLKNPAWNNTHVLQGDAMAAVGEAQEGAARRYPGPWQHHPGQRPEEARPGRRVPVDGLPHHPRQRAADVR